MTKPDSEVAQILERLRRQVDSARREQPLRAVAAAAIHPAPASEEWDSSQDALVSLSLEIEAALSGHQDFGQINPRPPGLISSLIQFFKKIFRRALSWYTRPLHVFQAAVIRALRQALAIFEVHEDHLQRVREQLQPVPGQLQQLRNEANTANAQLQAQVDELRRRVVDQQTVQHRAWDEKIVQVHAKISALSQQLARELEGLGSQVSHERRELLALIQRQRSRERDVRRLAYAIESGGAPRSSESNEFSTSPAISGGQQQEEFDYFVFEERYRGDEKLIHDRQQEYLEYFCGRSDVVDIGCGRGEFLELMRENGVTARGVELGLDQYLLCREKGLDVVREDLFTFLESIPDESLGGLFSAQVIEHLTAQDQLRYVALAYRKTSPGSPVIFETINALSVFAVLNNYLMDPTHIRLVHPKLLEFVMQSVKFRDVRLKFLSPVTDRTIPPLRLGTDSANLAEFNSAIAQLNDLIYGYQDFAAIGWH